MWWNVVKNHPANKLTGCAAALTSKRRQDAGRQDLPKPKVLIKILISTDCIDVFQKILEFSKAKLEGMKIF
ncbi:MAG: hypothetical protein ACO1O1_00125 [Adhaeribacter sp.]